jgi:hypothetical protein
MNRTAVFAALLTAAATSAWAEPSLSIDKALKIANNYLKENGRKETFIKSITLDPTSLSKNQYVWSAMWGVPVQLDESKRESGIEIQMDGSIARYTEKTGSSTNTPGTVGIPADRAALLNHRTRSDRPSILDLKH